MVAGWEKIDEQLRMRQERQQERLADWASQSQREAREELAETQRALLRDFRGQLAAMAAEARTLQEEGAHRLDEQLAGIERLHRRLVEEQSTAAELQTAQRSQLSNAGEQIAHTLGRVRSELSDLRSEGGREVSRLVERMEEVARGADALQRRLGEGAEAQARTLRGASEGLAETLARIDRQLSRLHDADDARLRAAGELVEALSLLRREAEGARAHVSRDAEAQLAALLDRTEAIAARVAEPWEHQARRLEDLHARVERSVRGAERRSAREILEDLFRRR